MTQKEIDLILRMFGKFLSSEQGIKLAHTFSNDIRFRLNPNQHLNPDSIKRQRGNHYVMIDIIYDKPSEVMINWKNQPTIKDMYNEIRPWLSIFGFPSTVDPIIVVKKKNENFPL
jgi:hypothetical protein